ncbi:hypothetical protein FA13DRAFT_780388 [Coprinellus micaceus]|uniref:Uncharacterized protein n=1 Tax=Coprinellus micaceus TaxID=71717 RepID=A0A4Y7S724_COPMI|nr:hypothetical protein FA13DRAFT_780388 [Coprinellus micaceus]
MTIQGVAFVDTEVHTLERNWEFLSSVFIDLSSPLVQRAPSTWYCDVEGLYFSIPSTWCPAPMPTGPHLLATFGPLRDGEESVSVSFHRFLAFDLAIKNVRSVNGRTLLSYGTEDMVDAVQRIMNFSTGLQLFGASLFDCPADPTLVCTWRDVAPLTDLGRFTRASDYAFAGRREVLQIWYTSPRGAVYTSESVLEIVQEALIRARRHDTEYVHRGVGVNRRAP